MDEKNKMRPDSKEKTEEQKLEEKLLRQSEMAEIFDRTESRNKKVDRSKEDVIIQLVGGGTLDLNVQRSVLAAQLQRHPSQFHIDFYAEVFKILNLSGDPTFFFKDKAVADFTVELIYGRFLREDFATILSKNKYVGFFRRGHWHYQFLDEKGIAMLQLFIHQAIESMRAATSYYGFRKDMFEKYGVPYQQEIFN